MALSRNVVCFLLISPNGHFDDKKLLGSFRYSEDDVFGRIGYYPTNLLSIRAPLVTVSSLAFGLGNFATSGDVFPMEHSPC